MKTGNVVLLTLAIALMAVSTKAQGRCSVEAFINDRSRPADISIRSAPNSAAKRIGKIPFAGDDDDQLAMLDIVGFSPGWLRINHAETVSGVKLFDGDGWIPATRVRTNVQTRTDRAATLYALASKSSKRVGQIPTESFVEIVGFSCFGFKVKYKNKIGWLPKQNSCGNPVTTCS